MYAKSLLSILAACAAFISAATCRPTPRAQDPTTDPFYQAPVGFDAQPPGTILRQRQIAAAFLGFFPDPVNAYQLLYRTTAINGSAIAAVTTVFKPFNSMADRFISFHTAYDSASVPCEPSYQYQLGVVPTDFMASMERFLFQQYLLKGYIVISPDHEGPDSALGAGRLAGMVVLDAMRAVSHFHDTLGFSTDRPAIVGIGYSGGAIATGWAASLHSSYAPELNIKGWAQGGTPSNVTGTMLHVDNTVWSGLIPPALDGLLKPSAYGAQLQPVIDSIITDQGQIYLDFANRNCFIADLVNFRNKSILSTDLQSLGPAILQEPTIQRILADNILGANKAETPVAPVLVYHGADDATIPYEDAAAMVESWCNGGANVTFTTYVDHGHTSTVLLSQPEVGSFIESAFAGTVPGGCSSGEWTG
ncbi:secretory lipase-domain-containing protein [Aspergillus egyptiacus]|nr:secretory lipase-domain-containing protein [Aspergillus egyptiacus]